VEFTTTTVRTALAAAAMTAVGVFPAATAAGAGPNVQSLGASERLVEGPLVTEYAVNNLRPSNAAIPGFQPAGQLYQADVVAKSLGGTVQPNISNFIARAFNGTVYPVVNTRPVPNGLDPGPIVAGGQTSGGLYFDVTGQGPVDVVYTDGTRDVLVWARHV
jgi:hypothetical protein